jgi:FtsP/CotA-like multicopper oxidase with cupredoxin domain
MTLTRVSPVWKNASGEIRAIRNIFLLLPALALLYASTLHATTVVLNPARDTAIYDGSVAAGTLQNNSCGAGPDFFYPQLRPQSPKSQACITGHGVVQYEIAMTQHQQQLHRDLPPTDVWTYAGSYPGPTIEAVTGQPIEVKYNNLPAGSHYLDVDTCAHGPNYRGDSPRTVPHLHGGQVPAWFDGQPMYDFLPGDLDICEYPNNQPAATLWYHDHSLGITRL